MTVFLKIAFETATRPLHHFVSSLAFFFFIHLCLTSFLLRLSVSFYVRVRV